VIISITLYVFALVLIYFYAIPALRKAARMVEEGVVGGRPEMPDDATTQFTPSTEDLRTKERLDAISGRIIGVGVLVLLVIAAITVLMSARPFGS
jgi:hypothetical protein